MKDIRDLPAATRRLLVLNMVNNLGSGLIMPFLVVYVHEVNGLSVTVATTALAVVSAGALAGAPMAGRLADRRGAEVAAVAHLTVQAVGLMSYAAASTPAQFMVSAAVFGIGIGGAAAWNTMLARSAPSSVHPIVFSLNFTAVNVSIGLGGLVGAATVSLAHPASFRVLYVVDAVSCALVALAVVVNLVGKRSPATERASEPARKEVSYSILLRHPAFLAVLAAGGALFCVTYAQFESGFPVYVITHTRLTAAELGVLFAANTVCVVAAQLALHRTLKRLAHTRSLVTAASLWAISWALVSATALTGEHAPQFALLLAAVAVFAVAETFYAAGMPTLVNALAPDEARGRFNAAHSMSMSIGFMVGPLAAGVFLGGTGAGWFLVAMCLVCLCVAGVFAGARLRLPDQVTRKSEPDGYAPVRTTTSQPEEA
ncbi:MFS transporter [Lentzea pudingi]|nr:MFS transporter [Lentzea pudingi]